MEAKWRDRNQQDTVVLAHNVESVASGGGSAMNWKSEPEDDFHYQPQHQQLQYQQQPNNPTTGAGLCRFVHTQCEKELFTTEYLRCVCVFAWCWSAPRVKHSSFASHDCPSYLCAT